MKIYNCHICKKKLTKILDLNRQPPANSIYKKKKTKSLSLNFIFLQTMQSPSTY